VNFTVKGADAGDATIKAKLWNLVSVLDLVYQLTIMEVVTAINLEVVGFETSEFPVTAPFQSGQSVDCSVAMPLTFRLRASDGSHLTLYINYSDNDTDDIVLPVLLGKDFTAQFSHAYLTPGRYDLIINATNAVSSVSSIFVQAVRVFEDVSGFEVTAKYIDIDEDFNEIDIFQEFSELYVLYYEKQGFER